MRQIGSLCLTLHPGGVIRQLSEVIHVHEPRLRSIGIATRPAAPGVAGWESWEEATYPGHLPGRSRRGLTAHDYDYTLKKFRQCMCYVWYQKLLSAEN